VRFFPFQKLRRWLTALAGLNIPLYAANAGFFLVLSLFPALVLVLSLLRYTGLDVQSLSAALESLIPGALLPFARDLIHSAYSNTSAGLVGISALAALWSSGKGVYGLLTGLNAIYQLSESRSWLRLRLISAGYTLVFLLVVPAVLLLQVFGSAVSTYLAEKSTVFSLLFLRLPALRFLLVLFLQTLLFSTVFTVFPNRRGRFRESLPGALLASAGWLIFSDLYSVYVRYFNTLSHIYGSVYTVALGMLWLYCCLSILFFGGAVNRFLAGKCGAGP